MSIKENVNKHIRIDGVIRMSLTKIETTISEMNKILKETLHSSKWNIPISLHYQRKYTHKNKKRWQREYFREILMHNKSYEYEAVNFLMYANVHNYWLNDEMSIPKK